MTKIQTFSLNGQNYSSQNRFTIFDLLKYFDYNLSLLVIEYNNYICPKNNWKKIYIMKSPEAWDRFMRFMERYGENNGLVFTKAN